MSEIGEQAFIGVKLLKEIRTPSFSNCPALTKVASSNEFQQTCLAHLNSLQVTFYESKYQKLEEAALVLEPAVWKAKINESRSDDVVREDVHNKKGTMDKLEFKIQCQIILSRMFCQFFLLSR